MRISLENTRHETLNAVLAPISYTQIFSTVSISLTLNSLPISLFVYEVKRRVFVTPNASGMSKIISGKVQVTLDGGRQFAGNVTFFFDASTYADSPCTRFLSVSLSVESIVAKQQSVARPANSVQQKMTRSLTGITADQGARSDQGLGAF